MAFSFRAGTNWCHDFPKLARDSGFHFNMHRTRVRVDWNRISSINIDRVVRERDFSIIDDNVNNVVDYCLESEYDVKILDPNFVKLFRLAQLAVEYLLYCKQYLDHSVIILKDELRSKLEENVKFKKDLKASEETVKELKEKLKERTRVIETKLSDSHGEIHKCPHCPKTFISALFMSAHVNRRHPNLSQLNLSSPAHEEYRAEAEKLHNEIKTLKERLNQTERVINESDKLLRSDSVVSNRDKVNEVNDERNHREQDERIEEQHRRYQEEISNLKASLFSEIRNLKLADRYNWGKHDTDDYNNGNLKELFRQQENEIQRLRDQLNKRLTPDIEGIQAKLDDQEDHWRSKLDYLESRHRMDIEKLYKQLKVTQESAENMRIDYLSKINDLEKRSQSESNLISTGNPLSDRFLSPSRQRSYVRPRESRRASDHTLSVRQNQNHYIVREKHQSDDKVNLENEDLRNVPENLENDEQLVVEDLDSASSKDAIIKESPIPLKKLLQRTADTEKTVDKKTLIQESKDVNQRKSNASSRRKTHETLRNDITQSNSDILHQRIIEKQELSSLDSVDNGIQDSVVIYDTRLPELSENPKIKESIFTKNVARESPIHRLKPEVANSGNKVVVNNRRKPLVAKRIDRAVTDSYQSKKNSERSESETGGSDEGSESWSESDSAESDVPAESQTEETEDSELSQVEMNLRNRERRNQKTNIDNVPRTVEECNEDLVEQFDYKLRDLGIDPEWQGIPSATFKQIMEIVKHHRNINAKKYHKFDEIRRKLIQELARKLSSRQKAVRVDDTVKRSPLDKLMTNVKSKACKALNILEKNEGSHSGKPTISSSREGKTDAAHSSALNLLPTKMREKDVRSLKSESPQIQYKSRNTEERQRSSRPVPRIPEQMTYERYTVAPSKPAVKLVDSTSDMKHLSHSYESIKDFLKDANSQRPQRSALHVTETTLVTSTPHKNEGNHRRDSLTTTNETSSVKIVKQQDSTFGSPVSPKINGNKSVLKSATGSAGSLVKKKVLFDLESSTSVDKVAEQTKYSMKPIEIDVNKQNLNESDFDISSISDEQIQSQQTKESPQSGNIVLKTSQSEKIAQISKQIEKQLSLTRRKPVGAVEAMFMEKISLKTDGKDSPLHSYLSSASLTSSIGNTPTRKFPTKLNTDPKHPQPTPRIRQQFNSDPSSIQDLNSDEKDTNLDMDIDELLKME